MSRNRFHERYPSIALAVLIFGTILASVFITFRTSGMLLDSDASSELVLAQQLAQTHSLLSDGWFYSTELRVLDSNLVYSLMFSVFSDWRLVRFFSSLTMQLLLAGSFLFLMRSTDRRWSQILPFACILLVPFSVTYGRIVLYHCYYTFHVFWSFLLIGLLCRILKASGKRRILPSVLFVLLSFTVSLNGVRQLLITFVPLVLETILLVFSPVFRTSGPFRLAGKGRSMLLWAVLGSCAASAGYLINSLFLAPAYELGTYYQTTLSVLSSEKWSDLLESFLINFGYRTHVSLLSPLGILSILSALVILYLTAFLFHKAVRSSPDPQSIDRQILAHFFASSLIVLLSAFLIGGQGNMYFSLYFLPVAAWIVPAICCSWDPVADPDVHPCRPATEKLLSGIMAALLFLNGAANGLFFLGVPAFDQPYSGLYMQNRHYVQDIEWAAEYLEESGYEYGYAAYWDANIITELTDGKVKMICLHADYDESPAFSYYDWLTLKENKNADFDRTFLLIPTEDSPRFEALSVSGTCRVGYQDDFYTVYCFDNPEDFRLYLSGLS